MSATITQILEQNQSRGLMRIAVGLVLGLMVTLSLFWLMQYLIATFFPAILALIQFDTLFQFFVVLTAVGSIQFVIGSFLEIGSSWECINGRLSDKTVVLFDEGFVQKSFMFVDQSNDSRIETNHLHSYLVNIPLPDLIVSHIFFWVESMVSEFTKSLSTTPYLKIVIPEFP